MGFLGWRYTRLYHRVNNDLDHWLLVEKFRHRISILNSENTKTTKKWNLNKLKYDQVKQWYQGEIKRRLQEDMQQEKAS